MSEIVPLAEQKLLLRKQALARRKAQENKEEISRNIIAKFRELSVYRRARNVLFYVGVRSEVRTTADLAWELEHSQKQLVVPYCVGQELQLFRLSALDELVPGEFRIPEPKQELRNFSYKQIDIHDVDLVIVPGVAFDSQGFRLGNGFGFYDRLLAKALPKTSLVALAFECQVFPQIPTGEHDIQVHAVVTEQNIYQSRTQERRS